MKHELNISNEFCDDLTRVVMMESFFSILDSIKKLKKERKRLRKLGDELPTYKNEDYLHDKQMKKSLYRVIRYYSTPEQWDVFLEKIK